MDKGRGYLGRQEKVPTHERSWDIYNFMISPTCPPSTSFAMRGGWVVYPMIWGYGGTWKVDAATYDLSDVNITGVRVTFSQPYWYTLLVVSLYSPRPDNTGAKLLITGPWGLNISTKSWETSAEAESIMFNFSYQTGFNAAGSDAIPLGTIVARNDGDITGYNKFLPVDGVNRGRSYIFWTQNFRYRWSV